MADSMKDICRAVTKTDRFLVLLDQCFVWLFFKQSLVGLCLQV